jgi:hypothetical protein
MPATYKAINGGASAVNTSITVTPHASTVVGDILIAIMATESSITSVTPDQSGWTLATGAPLTISSVKSWTYIRFVAGGDPGTYTFTPNTTANWFSRGITWENASAINVTQFSTSGAVTTTPSATGVTTTVDGCTIIATFFAFGSHGSTTAASGFTNRFTDGDEAYMDMVQTTAGATGTVTPTFSDSDQWWMTVIALEPVVVGGTPLAVFHSHFVQQGFE